LRGENNMPKVKYKNNGYCNNEPEKVFEVYGTKTYSEYFRDYDSEWTEEKTDFLIYEYSEWRWVEAKNFVPVD
jgi:hypothetical protein